MIENKLLDDLLDDLEDRLDPESEDRLFNDWQTFLDGRSDSVIFTPARIRVTPPEVKPEHVNMNDALEHMDLMLMRELEAISRDIGVPGGDVLNIRCNYGSSILPSLFGVKNFIMPYENDTLPGSEPVEGGIDGIKKIIDGGVPSLDNGWGKKVFDTLDYFMEKLAPYPKLSKYIHIYHPDLQGALDVSEVLWGSGIFLEFYDNPDTILKLEELICETYIAFMEKWDRCYVTQDLKLVGHWNFMHRGRILIRDDSAMNLSPEMYDTFAKPFDERLLKHFGGGVVHFCGRGDHYIEKLCSIPYVTGINMSQPQYNDMEVIFKNTVDKGIPLLRFDKTTAEKAIAAGRDLHHLVDAPW